LAHASTVGAQATADRRTPGRRSPARQTVAVPTDDAAHDEALAHVRAACLALPEVTERLSHGSPTWFIRGKTTFVMFVDDHHGDGILGIWCAAPVGAQAELLASEPERFFRPPYVGHRGWIGVRLDVDPDWDELAGICADAYRTVAPKRLIAVLDAASDGD
jgi:hypothetical protein